MDWITGMQNALRYIEDNITEELDYAEISKRAYVSSFHFQRIFSILCGYTLGEYIRNRRLTLAGIELTAGTSKVIDVAVKYGYDSPDSFTKAFIRFHGITPSSVKNKGVRLKTFTPLKIKFTLEGGNTMEFKIMEKDTFTVIGAVREFNFETSYADIPKFWSEHFEKGGGKYVCGMYGICFDENKDSKSFKYIIADNYEPDREIPDGYVTKTFPAITWAVFPCKGAMPTSLQDVNTRIWNEWLPNCREYELAGNYNVEMYSDGDMRSSDYYSEIWIPVKKV
jgi:AraC family transcriptional regulator